MNYKEAAKTLIEACEDTTMEISIDSKGAEIYWEGLKIPAPPTEINKALKAIFVLHNLEAEQT